MSLLDWVGYKKRLINVMQELQQIVDELERELETTKGKLAKVMEAEVKVTKILIRVLKSLPS